MYYNKLQRRGVETDESTFKVLVCLETSAELNKATGVIAEVYKDERLAIDCVPYRREAVNRCKYNSYDVIILSDNEADGYELPETVYRIKMAQPATRVVLLCRVLSDEIKDLEYRNFIEDIVITPYQTQRLKDVLSRYSMAGFWD